MTVYSLRRPSAFRSALMLLVAAGVTTSAQAQRPVVRGDDVWFGVTGDIRIAPKWLLTTTAEGRRAEVIDVPRQQFVLGGVLRDIGHGLRVGAGGALWHTAPNDEFGPRRPTTERRTFQQFSGSHRWRGAGWNHRLRYEQRWISAEPVGNTERDWTYNARFREQLRVVIPLDDRAPANSKLYVMPNTELFVRTTKHEGTLFDQTRFGLALGLGVSSRLNLEINPMRQSLVRTDGRHEVHRVLQLTARWLTAKRAD